MKKLEVYIVCHNKDSFDHFLEINKEAPGKDFFYYVLAGNYHEIPEWMPADRTIVAQMLSDNIEDKKSLLTFTAWYALSRNNIIQSRYVGIFEYDCEFKKDLFELDLQANTITGFLYRELPDFMYLECMAVLNTLLHNIEKTQNVQKGFWCPTTNFIMSPIFLSNFVTYFLDFIPKIMTCKNHPHVHERLINVFAKNHGVELVYASDYLIHEQLCSHGIDFDAV